MMPIILYRRLPEFASHLRGPIEQQKMLGAATHETHATADPVLCGSQVAHLYAGDDPGACARFDRALDRGEEARVLVLARNSERDGKICGANHSNIDTGNGYELIDTIDSHRRLDLHHDQ